jgi:hypothetical protein
LLIAFSKLSAVFTTEAVVTTLGVVSGGVVCFGVVVVGGFGGDVGTIGVLAHPTPTVNTINRADVINIDFTFITNPPSYKY